MLAGDIFTLALVTFFGYARHGELNTAGRRILTTFLSLVFTWRLIVGLLLPRLK
jgi:hypothetical protein